MDDGQELSDVVCAEDRAEMEDFRARSQVDAAIFHLPGIAGAGCIYGPRISFHLRREGKNRIVAIIGRIEWLVGFSACAGLRRLDAATEGLLLLTNDGELANRLTHPTYEIAKTYLATVIGEANRRLIRTLKTGIELDDGPARADYVQIVDVHDGKSLIRVELHEGRKHIVRRMLKEVGYPVERLVRTRIHTVQLGDQTPGTIRALNDAELSSLYKAVGM